MVKRLLSIILTCSLVVVLFSLIVYSSDKVMEVELKVISFDKPTEVLVWRAEKKTEVLPGVYVGAGAEGVFKIGGSKYNAKQIQPGVTVRIRQVFKNDNWIVEKVEVVK